MKFYKKIAIFIIIIASVVLFRFAFGQELVTVTTFSADGITSSAVTLRGYAKNNLGTETENAFGLYFQLTAKLTAEGKPDYSESQPIYVDFVAPKSSKFFSDDVALESKPPKTKYYYRALANPGIGGTVGDDVIYGKDKDFTTPETSITLPPSTTEGTGVGGGNWCIREEIDGQVGCKGADRWKTAEGCKNANKGTCTEIYGLLAPLPFIGSEIETGGGASGLANYLKIIFRLAIGIIGILSVLMIVIAGMEYMTAESPFGKGEGKKRLTGAIVGLLIALASVIILQTIDPTILNLNLNLRKAELEFDGSIAGGTDANPNWSVCKGGKKPPNQGNEKCENCVDLTESGISVISSGKQVTSSFKDILVKLKDETQIQWKITEAFSPSIKRHCANCHYIGTCVDLDFVSDSEKTAIKIKELVDAAIKSGVSRIEYEVSSEARMNTLISGGVPAENIRNYGSHITGEHYSVYK